MVTDFDTLGGATGASSGTLPRVPVSSPIVPPPVKPVGGTDSSGKPVYNTPNDSPTPTPNLLPRVPQTPQQSLGDAKEITGNNWNPTPIGPDGKPISPTTTATAPTPTASDYIKNFKAPDSEETTYEKLLDQAKGNVTDVISGYNDQIARSNKNVAGYGASTGSSGFATTQAENEATKPIIEARTKALNDIYSTVRNNAISLYENDKNRALTSAEDSIALERQARTDAQDSIKTMAAAHLDWNDYKSNNPDNYNALVKSLGGDPNVADALFAMSAPAETVQNQYSVSDGKGGTTVNQIVQDPVTGAVRHVTYDLPGVTIPPTYSYTKSGTNSGYFAPSDFAQNPDPSKLIFISSDPTNGNAITVTKDGQTTVNGVPINQTPGASDTPTTGTTSTVGAAGTIASIVGLQDPTLPLSAVIADPSIGLDGVVAGIIQNEGGSPKGVLNNPGNIKFVGLPGQKDSGVKATDGGTFASYDTAQAGKQAIGDLVTKGSNSGKNFDDFINSYTGTGSNSSQGSGSILNATGISLPVFNYLTQGTASLSRLSASQRKEIQNESTDFLNKNGIDISTFQSQYKAFNDTLAKNISRNNQTKVMENELTGTIKNLQGVVKDSELGDLNLQNVSKVWAGQQVNDPLATQYAFHFQQLKNELAGYFAASQGKSSPDVIDNNDAADAVINGMSTGSLNGLQKSIENSTDKMSSVLQSSVDDAQKSVWGLFGVGDKYQPKGGTTSTPTGRTDMTDQGAKDFVEKTLTAHGQKYDDIIAQYTPSLQSGEKLALDNKTGAIIAVKSSDDPNSYTPL